MKGCGVFMTGPDGERARCGDTAHQDPEDYRPPGMRVCPACYERLMAPRTPAERMRTHIAHASNCSQPGICGCG